MSTYFSTLYNVIGTTYRSRQYLCLIPLDSIDIYNLFYQLYAFPTTIVYTANERRNIFSAGFRSQYSLSCRETQGTVGSNTIISKPFNGFHAFLYHRHFHYNIGM